MFNFEDSNFMKEFKNEKVIHKCKKCSKEEQYNINGGVSVYQVLVKENQWHNINLGRMGYGSCMDGDVIDFEICDQCLYDLVKEME